MVSDIEIRLRADIARLQQDMDQARRAVGGALDRIDSAVGNTVKLLKGLAIAEAAITFAKFIKGSIDAADALNDLSVRTSISIEDLSGLDYAAKLSGSSLEGVAASISKLSLNIGKDAEKFRELGVTATDPVEAFKQLADVFKAIQDPQQRAAFGAEALGKSWQEAAPLLAEGAKGIDKLIAKGKNLTGVTDEVAADAAKFNDSLDDLGFAVRRAGLRIASDLLPMLQLLADNMNDAGKSASDTHNDFSLLAETLRAVVLVAGGVAFAFQVIGKTMAAAAAQVGLMREALQEFFKFQTIFTTLENAAGKLGQAFGEDSVGAAWVDDVDKATEAFGRWGQSWIDVGNAAKDAGEEMAAVSADQIVQSLEASMAAEDAAKKAAAFLKAEEIAAARKKAAEEAAKAAEKEREAYQGLIGTLREKQAANQHEIDIGAALAESKKEIAKFDREIKDGKLVLTAAHQAEVRTMMESVGAQDAYLAAVRTLNSEREAAVSSAQAEAESQERLVKEFGMTKRAIDAVTLARAEERLAQRASLELKEVKMLEAIVAAKKRSVAAGETLEALEAQKKATEEAATEQKAFWESIDKTAHDTFVNIANGGKDTAQRLKDTFKNTFFDWLYQMTIKKWIINIGTSVTGTGGAVGAKGGGLMGNMSTWISAGKAMYGAFSSGIAGSMGALIGEMGSLFGSTAISAFGSGMSGTMVGTMAGMGPTVAGSATGIGAMGAGGAASGAASAGASAASMVPIVGWIIAGMIANDKYFKEGWDIQGQKGEITEMFLKSAMRGNFISGLGAGATVSIGAADTLLRKIGLNDRMASLFSGSSLWARAFGHRKTTVEATGIQGQLTTAGFSGQAFAELLKKGGWFRSDKRSTQTGALGAEQQAGLDETIQGIAAAVKGFGAVLGAETAVIDGYSKQIKLTFGKDEAANQKAIQDLFSGVVDELSAMLIPNLAALALEGEKASDTLGRVATNYMALDAILKALGDDFGAVGLSSLEARERFLALNGGLEKLAANTQIFAENFLTEAERLAPVQRHVSEQLAVLGMSSLRTRDQFKDAVFAIDKTTEAGARQHAAMMDLAAAFAQVTQVSEDAAAAAASQIDSLRSLAAALRGPITAVNTPQQLVASRGAARAEIAATLAIARAGGPLPTEEKLRGAISTLGSNAADQHSTMTEYLREQAATAADLNALADIADMRANIADQTLAVMQGQRADAQAASAAQISRLDGILATSEQQLALTSQASQTQALTDRVALQDIAPQGRAEVSAGGSEIVAELRALNTRMASVESSMTRTANSTSQFASQFDNVSAGGSIILTEAA